MCEFCTKRALGGIASVYADWSISSPFSSPPLGRTDDGTALAVQVCHLRAATFEQMQTEVGLLRVCVGITEHAQHPLLGVYRHSHLAIQNLHEQITDQITPPSAQDRQVRRLALFLGFDESLKVTARGQQRGGDLGFGCARL